MVRGVISAVDLASSLLKVIIDNNEDYLGNVYVHIGDKLLVIEDFDHAHGRMYAIVKEVER